MHLEQVGHHGDDERLRDGLGNADRLICYAKFGSG
jgi:hypothetical protein